jgi:hypothetical protein
MSTASSRLRRYEPGDDDLVDLGRFSRARRGDDGLIGRLRQGGERRRGDQGESRGAQDSVLHFR